MDAQHARNLAAVKQEYELVGDATRSTAQLDILLMETIVELNTLTRYPATAKGEANMLMDAYRFLAITCPTLTNEELGQAIARWARINASQVSY